MEFTFFLISPLSQSQEEAHSHCPLPSCCLWIIFAFHILNSTISPFLKSISDYHLLSIMFCYLSTFKLFFYILKILIANIFECDYLLLFVKLVLCSFFAGFLSLHQKGGISSRSYPQPLMLFLLSSLSGELHSFNLFNLQMSLQSRSLAQTVSELQAGISKHLCTIFLTYCQVQQTIFKNECTLLSSGSPSACLLSVKSSHVEENAQTDFQCLSLFHHPSISLATMPHQ